MQCSQSISSATWKYVTESPTISANRKRPRSPTRLHMLRIYRASKDDQTIVEQISRNLGRFKAPNFHIFHLDDRRRCRDGRCFAENHRNRPRR